MWYFSKKLYSNEQLITWGLLLTPLCLAFFFELHLAQYLNEDYFILPENAFFYFDRNNTFNITLGKLGQFRHTPFGNLLQTTILLFTKDPIWVRIIYIILKFFGLLAIYFSFAHLFENKKNI